MDDQDRPTRAVNIALVERRQVREAMGKIAVGLEEMQRETAFLNAMAEHRKSAPDVAALRKKVEATNVKLERAVAKLPEHLRNHGRITDLRKAIASLEGLLTGEDR